MATKPKTSQASKHPWKALCPHWVLSFKLGQRLQVVAVSANGTSFVCLRIYLEGPCFGDCNYSTSFGQVYDS